MYFCLKKIAEKMKITIIAGARPNFMKIAPLIRSIHAAQTEGKNIQARLVYTGSAQDKSLEPSLFQDLDMPCPDTCLNVESNDFFQRLASIIVAFAQELDEHPADLVMVVDDLTPTMACSIVARKKGIKIAHLVAGIRSFDMDMPKEANRMITDGLRTFFSRPVCRPTETSTKQELNRSMCILWAISSWIRYATITTDLSSRIFSLH